MSESDINQQLLDKEFSSGSEASSNKKQNEPFGHNNYDLGARDNRAEHVGKKGFSVTGNSAELLSNDEIEEKSGSYLLSVGYAGSGKTTFQSFLTYYLSHESPHSVEHASDPTESAQGWAPMRIYNDWVSRWHDGSFPLSTATGEDGIREISLRIETPIGKKTPLDLTFLEVSGENLQQVIAGDDNDPIMLRTLHRFFENKKIKWAICLVLDPGQEDANDRLFENFIRFLDVNYENIRQEMRIAVLVSKPNEALRLLKQRNPKYQHIQEMRGDVLEAYVANVAPRTLKIMDAWPDQNATSIMSLKIGDITESPDGTQKVSRKDCRDIKQIFEWLYHQFTGTKLKPTWWQQLIQWLRE
jgi:energy-coupling factor transporter ATP-binding protein EcfA2